MAYFTGYFDSYFDVAAGSIESGVGAASGVASGDAVGRSVSVLTELSASGLPVTWGEIGDKTPANVTIEGAADSAGTTAAQATGESTAASVGSAIGIAEALSAGIGIAASIAASEGLSTADATAEPLGTIEAAGEATGASTAAAVGQQIGGEVEQPTGGWGAQNEYRRQRQLARWRRKQRELEEEADRLEMALAAEGLVTPDPVVEHRYTVTEYKHLAPTFNRRTQRAIDYAERARTALAYELAAKAIAQAIEDDEMALLMAVALVA